MWDLPPLRAQAEHLASEATESDGVRVVRFFTLEPRTFVLDDNDHPAISTEGGEGGEGGTGAQAPVPRLSAKLTVRPLR